MRWAVDGLQPEGRDRRDLRADDDERAVMTRFLLAAFLLASAASAAPAPARPPRAGAAPPVYDVPHRRHLSARSRAPSPRASSTSTASSTRAPARSASRPSAGSASRTAGCSSRCRSRPASSARASSTGATRSSRSPGQAASAIAGTGATLRRLGEWRYPGEGWGLTQNGTRHHHERRHRRAALPRSRDAGRAPARRPSPIDGQPVERLNELEWVNGEIFANIWQTADDRPHRPGRAAGSPA